MEEKINSGVTRTGETDIRLNLIDSFPNHPYHVFDDEDMTELTASIEANGLLNPIIVRSKADGRYELISGHRRKRAYEILKIKIIRAIIVDVSDDEAIIMMVDSNCQRSKILPSEKAFSYKMKLEAIKRQGKRNDLTCAQLEHKSKKSREIVGEQIGESAAQVARYIRLTELIPELLDFVDKGRMKMQPAVELSYLDEESQRDLVDIIVNEFEGINEDVETSTAQSISVIFAFIAGVIKMARQSQNPENEMLVSEPYPLVMDAPLSAFDKTRIRTVCDALPKVAEQVIIFIKDTDGELAETYMGDKVGSRFEFDKKNEFETNLVTR